MNWVVVEVSGFRLRGNWQREEVAGWERGAELRQFTVGDVARGWRRYDLNGSEVSQEDLRHRGKKQLLEAPGKFNREKLTK